MTPIRIVLLGLNFGEEIARHIVKHVPHLQLKAVCDLDQTRASLLARELSVKSVSLAELLSDPEIEAIGLFTGPIERPALIEKILTSGRHVLTTKPFALEPTSAARVLRQAQEENLVVHLNAPGPEPTQDKLAIAQFVSDHALGRPVALRAETWAHYREKANGTWYDSLENCPAAPIVRLGIYFLSDFLPLLGTPEELHVHQSRVFTKRPTADQAQISIRFSTGALASVFSSFCVEDILSAHDGSTRVPIGPISALMRQPALLFGVRSEWRMLPLSW